MNIEVMTSPLRHRRKKRRSISLTQPRYRWELLPKVASNIEYGNRSQAHRDLDALLESFARDSGHDLELQKIRCFQTMSAVMRGARRGGAAADALFKDHLVTLNAISKLKSWRAVVRSMHKYVDHLFTQTADAGKNANSGMRSKVDRVLAGIRASLSRPRTLEHYAGELRVSTGHLSRSFTAIVGRPFRDEVRRLRNEEACRLLVHSQLKLAAIAARVGMQSASQFIADFRRDLGITPAQYRKRHPRRRPVREFAL